MIEDLRDGRAGTVSFPDDGDWDRVSARHAPLGKPGVIVRPETVGQISAGVEAARDAGLSITVRSGGHSGAAYADDGGVLIDLAAFDAIEVSDGCVSVGAGADWAAVADMLTPHRLAVSSGDTASVGVGGLTLGGGIGWFVRERGLTIDSLTSAEVVLASGDVVRASADENPDLFWALRGGGGNFGIVTRFTFTAHPLDGVVFGTFRFSGPVEPLLRAWRDLMRSLPETVGATFVRLPAADPFAAQMGDGPQLIVCLPGDQDSAAEVLDLFRELPGYDADDAAAAEYRDILIEPALLGDGQPPVFAADNVFLGELSEAVTGAIGGYALAAPEAMLMIRYLRGAYNRISADATAWAYRGAEAWITTVAFLPPHADATAQAEALVPWRSVAAAGEGLYGGFVLTAGDAMVERMYPPRTLDRLRAVKRRYDPGNVFERNQNVRP